MPYTPMQFRPGINREVTSHTNEGGWVDCDKIRFRSGFPETIGGWTRVSDAQYVGAARALHTWTALRGVSYVGVGTSYKFYLLEDASTQYDITPIRETTAAGDVTFSAADGDSTLTVTDTSHGALVGDRVTFSGAVTLGGLVTADVLNAEHTISAVLTNDTYEIELAVTANASDTGNGGASVVGEYQINTGLSDSTFGSGWGAGAWGAGGWGDETTLTVSGTGLRLWGVDNYGEDLLFNVRGAGVYYWDATSGASSRGVALSSLPGANKTPTVALQVLTSDRDRHAVALGTDDEFAAGTLDPLLIRFSAQEDITDWESREDNTAGALRISSGSTIIAGVKTRQQILIITDVSVHAMQYVGAPFTFGLSELARGTTISGPNAAVAVNDEVFWMGEGVFFRYRGTVQQIPCTVREYVFSDFNISQAAKVYAGHNAEFSEVWWFYPSAASEENDRYVVFNYEANIWYYGSLARTAWQQRGVFGFSIAASTDGYLYYHDTGMNDGSQNPAVGIRAYIESSPVDISNGDRFMFVDRIIPDVTFRSSTGTPTVTFIAKVQDWPGQAYNTKTEEETVSRTASSPIDLYTRELYVRLRGRAMALRVESDQRNTAWRLGTPRANVRTDGRA